MVKSKKNRPKRTKRNNSKKSKIMYGGADIREKGLAVDIRDILKMTKDYGDSIPIDTSLFSFADEKTPAGLLNQIIHNDDIHSKFGHKNELGDKFMSSDAARQIMDEILKGLDRLKPDSLNRETDFPAFKQNINVCLRKLNELNRKIPEEKTIYDELAKVRYELQKKDADVGNTDKMNESLKDEQQKNQAIQAQKNSEITAKNKRIQDCEQELKRVRNSLQVCNDDKKSLQDKLNAYMSKPAAVKPASPPTTSFSPPSPTSFSSSSPTASSVVVKPTAAANTTAAPTTAPTTATAAPNITPPTTTANTNAATTNKSNMSRSTPTMITSALNDIDDGDDDENDFAPSAPSFDLAPKKDEEDEVTEIFASVNAIIKKESGGDSEKAKCLDDFIKTVQISREFKASLLDLALKESSSNIQKGKRYFDIFTQKVFDELCFYTQEFIDINDKNMFRDYISQKAKVALHVTGIMTRVFTDLLDMIEDVKRYKTVKSAEDRLTTLLDYKDVFASSKNDIDQMTDFKMKCMCGNNGGGYFSYLQCLIVVIQKFKQLKIDKYIADTQRISEYFSPEKTKLIVKEKTKDTEYRLPPCIWFDDIDYYTQDFAFYKPEFLKTIEAIKYECSHAAGDVLKEDTLIPKIDHLKSIKSNIELNYVKFIFGCALSETDKKSFKDVSLSLSKYITSVKVFIEPASTSSTGTTVPRVKTDKQIEYLEDLNKLRDICNTINKFVEPSSEASFKEAEEADIKKSQEKMGVKTQITPEEQQERNKIFDTVAEVITNYSAEGGKKEEKAICLHNFIEKGTTLIGKNRKPKLLSLSLRESTIEGGRIDFDKFTENIFDRFCFYTREFASINQSKDGYVAQKADSFINPIAIVPSVFEDFDQANKISKSLIGKSEEEREKILSEYENRTFAPLEYTLEQPQVFKTDYMCDDNGVGYYKYLWQLISVIRQMPDIMQKYPPDKGGNITISDYIKEKISNAKVGDMEFQTCVWFDDIDRYTKISEAFTLKFQMTIQQIQHECSYNTSVVLKEANLEAKIERLNYLIIELEENTVKFVFGCVLNDKNEKLFQETYKMFLKYYMNVKKSFDSSSSAASSAQDVSGAQKKYVDNVDLLAKILFLVIKFVNPVSPGEIAKAMEVMSNPGKKGGRKRILKRSNRKTKKIKKFVKRMRKSVKRGKK